MTTKAFLHAIDVGCAIRGMGTDELVFFTWSTVIEQIDRLADLLG